MWYKIIHHLMKICSFLWKVFVFGGSNVREHYLELPLINVTLNIDIENI